MGQNGLWFYDGNVVVLWWKMWKWLKILKFRLYNIYAGVATPLSKIKQKYKIMGLFNRKHTNDRSRQRDERPRFLKEASIGNGEVTIGICPDGSIAVLIQDEPYEGEILPLLRDVIAPTLRFRVEPRWNTRELGRKLVDYINQIDPRWNTSELGRELIDDINKLQEGNGHGGSNQKKIYRIIYHYEAIPRGLVVEGETLDEAMRNARNLIARGKDEWEETETEECFTHMFIEQAIIDGDDADDYEWDWLGDTQSDIKSWKGEKYERLS